MSLLVMAVEARVLDAVHDDAGEADHLLDVA